MGETLPKLVSLGLLFVAGCGEVKERSTPDAPVIPSYTVQIAPEMPRTRDDLVATVVGQSAPTGSTWRWSVDGAERSGLTTETVPNVETSKDQVWKAELLDGDGAVAASAEVTIHNTPPTAPGISYTPAAPTASLPIQCRIDTLSTDDDNDTITYGATWTNNGTAFASTSTTVFPADTIGGAFTKVNDVFHCTVIANDGTDSSVGDAGNAAAAACRVYGTSATLNANGTGPAGTVQTFAVPAGVCSVRIEVAGSKGGPGTGSATNTNGARMIGTFTVTEGDTLKVMVGQLPTGSNALGGGGGTFVTTMANAPLIIAGGGGSNGCFIAGCTITDAELMGRIVTSGGTAGGTPRADNGQGGNIVAGAFTSGGGGLLANGAGTGFGAAFVNGGAGGNAGDGGGIGGYGGGGARSGSFGEGGGGGYSGGSCGSTTSAWIGCGGGGSINNGAAQANTAGINAAAGYARFTY